MPELNQRQSDYVSFRSQGFGVQESYLRAGYSPSGDTQKQAGKVEARAAVKAALQQIRNTVFERNVGSIEYIIKQCVEIVAEARSGGPKTLGPAVAALNLLAKRFPEFKDSTNIDARQINLVIPEGTSLDDLKRLKADLEGSAPEEALAELS